MGNRIVRQNVEGVITAYLTSKLGGVPARTTRTSAAREVTVERIGGTMVNVMHERAFIAVQAWDAGGKKGAFDLAADALSWLEVMEEPGAWIGSDDAASSIIWFPDPKLNTPRYQFTLHVMSGGLEA